MALVSFEAEFMKQLVPSVPISGAQAFQAVHDEQSRPIIFSIAPGGSLYALLPEGTNGQASPLDLHSLFGLSSSTVVSALSVLQDKQRAIYLTFAVDGSKPGDPSSIYVVRPTQPAEWLAASKVTKSAPSLLKDLSTEKRVVKRLCLAGSAHPTTGYPPLIVVYSEIGSTLTDAACLDINVPDKQWKYSDTFKLPETPENMVDMCAGTLPAGINGLFCLYDTQGTRYLTFTGFKSGPYHQSYSTSLHVPPGAKSLATFVNAQGLTDLLLGGTAVTHYPAITAVHSDPPGGPDRFVRVTEDSDPYLKQVSQITVAQATSHNTLTIYGRNADDTVVYQRCAIVNPGSIVIKKKRKRIAKKNSGPAKVTLDGSSIPLLTRAQGGGHFTVLLDAATGSQRLFIVGEGGMLTRMEQSGGTHLWQPVPVLVPSAGENKEITTYTTHIHISDPNGVPITKTKFLLCSSSGVDLGSNGGAITATPDGVYVTTDDGGDITFIQNVTGLSSVVFTLKDDPQAAQPILSRTHIINPAFKVQQVLGTIKTPDNARNARLPSGQKLLDCATKPGGKDNAAEVLPLLCDALSRMPNDGSECMQTGPENSSIWDWGIFQWLSTALDDLENFFIDGWNFVVKIADKVYTFVLKTLAHVLKGVHWLLQDVLGIPIDKIIEWVGFLFQWDDILETHNVLAAIVNVGIDCAIAKVGNFATTVDEWFKYADDKIDDLKSIPADVRDRKTSRDSVNAQFKAQWVGALVGKTPGSNWSNYQLKHGGVKASLRAQSGDHPKSCDPLLQFWDDVARPALEKVRQTLQDAVENLVKLFQSSGGLSFGQLLENLGVTLLRDVLGVLRTIVVGLIKFIADFASDVKVLINTSINIPLLTPLYRLITKGKDLTMLDAIALLIAVPATVVYKAMTGQKPGDIDGVQEFLQAYKDHQSRFEASLVASTSPRPSRWVQMTSQERDPARIYFAAGVPLNEIIALVKKIASRIAGIVMPFVNSYFLATAPDDWYLPDTNGIFGWKSKITASIMGCVFTYPYDDTPGHDDLHMCRLLAWGLHIPTILAIPCETQIRGIVAFATSCFQLVPEAVSIPMAISSAEDGSYGGDLDPGMVWVDIGDRLFAMVGSAVGGICMIMTEPEPISFSVVFLTSGISIGCQLVKAAEYRPQAKTGVPQASLSRLL